MSRIGILGGSFDPCHRGHINLAIDAKEQGDLDEVVLMPARIQPFKQDKQATDAKHRVAMLKAAVEHIEGIEVSTWEIEQEGISYTYMTLDELKRSKGDEAEIYFISGTDSFLSMETWMKGEYMLRNYKFLVGVRPGYKLEELDETIERVRKLYNTDVKKIDNRRFHISSTEIRERLASDESISDLVTEEVERYIREHGLYI